MLKIKEEFIMSNLDAREEMVYTNRNFSFALELLKKGARISREGWNSKGLYVEIEKGGDYKFSELNPFFVIKNNLNSFNTWVPSVSDLLAEDWEIKIDRDREIVIPLEGNGVLEKLAEEVMERMCKKMQKHIKINI
jgi:hypothetical protein